MLTYRPDIDGLRAIAVLSVVIYHAQFYFGEQGQFLLPGGYLGVDIFFVISGYLISLIILKERQAEQFSFLDFYHRRSRRILPALFLVMTVSLPFAWFLLMPSALKEYAGSILSSLFFGSNFWFFNEDAYTAAPSQLKPFLHTWSLSVEEQFYLIFPPLVLLFWKLTNTTKAAITLTVFFASLGLAQWASYQFGNFNFYLLPSRAWELLMGVMVAGLVFYGVPIKLSKPQYTAWSLIALLLIILPLILFNKDTAHPSFWTLLPVVGTAMAMYLCQQMGYLQRLLSTRLLVWVGKWSYSLYLWHFPIFAFARIELTVLSAWQKMGLIAVSAVCAIISYYTLEQPMRKKNKIANTAFFAILTIWFTLLVTICAYFYSSDGVPSRLGSVQPIIDAAKYTPVIQNGQDCHQKTAQTSCKFIQSETQRMLINVGDSHANYLGSALKEYAEEHDLGYLQMTENACPMIRDGYGFREGKMIPNCHYGGQNPRIERTKRMPQGIIVYSGRFPLYLSAERFDNGEGGVEPVPISWISDNEAGVLYPNKTAKLVQNTIQELLKNGNFVVIVYPVPEVGWDVPKKIQQSLQKIPAQERREAFNHLNISTSYALYKKRSQSTFAMYDAIPNHPHLIRIYPDTLFCSAKTQRCKTHDDLGLFYADDDHISPYGAKIITQEIARKIRAKRWLSN